jgi:hypothetical protein
MRFPVHKNTKRSPILLLLGTLCLFACGGGNERTSATDLYGAYEVIEGGMSETQVNAVIGAEPDARQADGKQSQILTWEADPNTYRHITLLVTVHAQDGVTRKIITGYRGNKSQSY